MPREKALTIQFVWYWIWKPGDSNFWVKICYVVRVKAQNPPNSPEVPTGFSKSIRTNSKGFQTRFHILKGSRNCFKHSEKQICFNSARNLYDLYLLSNSSPVGLNRSKKYYIRSAVQLNRSKKNCIRSAVQPIPFERPV